MKQVSIGIAGGTGGMGRWFETFFHQAGHRVYIAGRQTEKSYADLVGTCEVIALSMPVTAAMDIAREIGPQMSADQLLIDFCSQKEPIVDVMASATAAEVIGTHPMFSPMTPSIADQNVILCPARGSFSEAGTWLPWLEGLLREKGAVVTRMTPAAHDEKMAISQSLMHFLTLALARMLQNMGLRAEDTFLFSTPIFRLNVDLIGRLFSQDITLYAELVSKNRHAPEIFDRFAAAMEECRTAFFAGDEQRLLAFFSEMRQFFGEAFCQSALRETNSALDRLYETVKEMNAEGKDTGENDSH